MDLDWRSILIGALLSAPIGLYINLVTPKVQQWLARRYGIGVERRIATLKLELETVNDLASNPTKLLAFVAAPILRFVVVVGMAAATAAFFICAPLLLSKEAAESVEPFIPAMAIINTLNFASVIRDARKSLVLLWQVKQIEKFRQETETELTRLHSANGKPRSV